MDCTYTLRVKIPKIVFETEQYLLIYDGECGSIRVLKRLSTPFERIIEHSAQTSGLDILKECMIRCTYNRRGRMKTIMKIDEAKVKMKKRGTSES